MFSIGLAYVLVPILDIPELIHKKTMAYRKLTVWLQIKQRSQLLANESF